MHLQIFVVVGGSFCNRWWWRWSWVYVMDCFDFLKDKYDWLSRFINYWLLGITKFSTFY